MCALVFIIPHVQVVGMFLLLCPVAQTGGRNSLRPTGKGGPRYYKQCCAGQEQTHGVETRDSISVSFELNLIDFFKSERELS